MFPRDVGVLTIWNVSTMGAYMFYRHFLLFNGWRKEKNDRNDCHCHHYRAMILTSAMHMYVNLLWFRDKSARWNDTWTVVKAMPSKRAMKKSATTTWKSMWPFSQSNSPNKMPSTSSFCKWKRAIKSHLDVASVKIEPKWTATKEKQLLFTFFHSFNHYLTCLHVNFEPKREFPLQKKNGRWVR